MTHQRLNVFHAEYLARQDLSLLKQTGTISDYVAQFRKIMMDLPNMHDGDAKFHFLQGLQYEAKLQVMLKEPSTLLEAYKQASTLKWYNRLHV